MLSLSKDQIPTISKIKIVGSYSTNETGEYCQDLSQLKYFKCPSDPNCINFDLNLNYHLTCRKSHLNDKMDLLFQWCLENYNQIHGPKNSKNPTPIDFICRRGVLKTFLDMLYDNCEWIISAVKIHNTIYLCVMDTDDYIQKIENETESDRRRSTWGLKFEQYVASDDPYEDPDPSKPLNEFEKFYCVFRSTFGTHSLLYAAEMDAVASKTFFKDSLVDKNVEFIELKTLPLTRLDNNGHVGKRHRNSLMKWWSQSYLTGTHKIIFGCRDEKGVVKKMKQYTLNKIILMCQNIWNNKICQRSLDEVLHHIKKTVTEDYNECAYKFHWHPEDRRLTHEIVDSSSDYFFLPQWYIEHIEMYKEKK